MHDHPDHSRRGRPARRRRSARATHLIAVWLVLAALAAACGGGGSNPGAAHGHSTSTTAAGASSGSSSYRSELAYAACMRSHGEPDFPDPSPSGGLNITNNPNDPNLQAAERACGHLLPGGGNQTTGGHFTPGEVAQLLNFARCMRAHGIVNYPDPTANGMGNLSGIDPNSPQFNAAQQACQSLMPNLGGTGPVTSPGSGS